MRRAALCLFCLSLFTAAVCGGAFRAFAETPAAREFATTVDSALKPSGVYAAITAVPDITARDPEAPTAVVFVSYEKAFRGTLLLRARDKNGADIGASAPVKVNEPAESGGHVHFVFEQDVVLENAAQFLLEGEKSETAPAP